jgi:hypothetical protein
LGARYNCSTGISHEFQRKNIERLSFMWIEIGKIGGVIIGGAVGALIGAVIVRLATNLTAKFIPPFGMAYKASFTGIFAITL